MGRVVLDTSVVLAVLDPDDALHHAAVDAMRRHRDRHAQFTLPASALAELLVGAARRGDGELQTRRQQVTAAFGSPVPLDEPVAVTAARLRARHRFLRLPDALVLATADVVDAETVLTGDKKWPRLDPRVELVSPPAVAPAA
ncbi:MAG: PIN domain-containing protein [Micromonosporaceae bacterium]|nr:PIN domain-containing protein [Micromonosporaceae bacterium]